MRIEKLEIGAYGCFVDRSIPNLPEGLVIVHGLNEAGKSTLFSLLTTLLYGFDPVSDFPYRPWHVDTYPELSAVLTLQDGTQTEVWRKLVSTPQGHFTRNGHTEKLANRHLPFVQHVSRDLYRALYAVTQANMRSLEKMQMKEIEDRLLSGLGAELLKPTRQVIADLEKQAQKLWRSDKRGKPLYADLQSKLHEAKKDRKQVVERDQSLRNKAERLHEVEKQISTLEEELAKLSAQLRKADLLLPLKERMDQIEKWRSDIPDIEAAQHLPDGLETEYRRLCDRAENAEEAIKRLKEERKTQVDAQERFTEEDRFILERAEKIDKWAHRATAHEQEQHNIENLERDVDELQRSLESTAASILAESWRDDFSPAVEGIVLPELRIRTNDFQEKEKAVEQRQTAIEGVAPVRMIGELPGWTAAGAITVGLLAVLLGIWFSRVAIIPGSTLTLIGITALVFNFFIRYQRSLLEAQRQNEIGRLQEQKREADGARNEARKDTKEILKNLPVASALLENPNDFLFQAVEGICSYVGERKQKTDHLQAQQENWKTAQDELQELVRECGEQKASLEAVNRLEDRLDTAKEHQRDFDQAANHIKDMNGKPEQAKRALRDAGQARDEFMKHVTQVVVEDLPPDEALKRAAELQGILRKIQNAEEQLEMDYPGLPEWQEKIRRLEKDNVDDRILDQAEVEKSRIRRDELQAKDGELQRLRDERARLRNETENTAEGISAGELNGKIESIEEQMEDVCTQHDRLILLASLLREADRQFREEHQPDVLKRASEYLNMVTSGRYTHIINLEDEDEEERLSVISKSGEDRLIAFPLSGGTLDQIYLAFRLAVIDHLDEAYERLPLVLDEVLINWDDQRFEAGMQILSRIAQKRQVFLFTCHDWIVKRIQDAAGISAIILDVS